MLSKFTAKSHSLLRSASARFEQRASLSFATRPALAEEKKEENATLAVNKEDPLHLPYKHHPYAEDLNAGKNLAPEGTYNWEDLPYPYNSYRVKVDPKDVEEPGMLWKLFSNPKTGVPLGGLLSLPLFYHNVILIDEVFELSLITLSTMVLIKQAAGDKLAQALRDMRDEVKQELLTAETNYNEALTECLDVHDRASRSSEFVRMINDGERSLRAVEAEAKTRAVKTAERNKVVAMLDYLALLKQSAEHERREAIAEETRALVQDAFKTDAKLQQSSVDAAVAALSGSALDTSIVEKTFVEMRQKAEKNVDARLSSSTAARKETARGIFQKRFALTETEVTEQMLARAQADKAEMAVLTARCGGKAPTVGAKINQKLVIDY